MNSSVAVHEGRCAWFLEVTRLNKPSGKAVLTVALLVITGATLALVPGVGISITQAAFYFGIPAGIVAVGGIAYCVCKNRHEDEEHGGGGDDGGGGEGLYPQLNASEDRVGHHRYV